MIMNWIGHREGLRHLLDEAYERGFEASGEGWNGEHPPQAVAPGNPSKPRSVKR